MIIRVDYKYSRDDIERMTTAVDREIARNVNLNGFTYEIIRDEYTALTTDAGAEPDENAFELFHFVIWPALDGRL